MYVNITRVMVTVLVVLGFIKYAKWDFQVEPVTALMTLSLLGFILIGLIVSFWNAFTVKGDDEHENK